MIKIFNDYNKLNEEEKINSDMAHMTLMLFLIFNSIGGDTSRRITPESLEKYITSSRVNPSFTDIGKVIKVVKNKVTHDPKITNKQEIFDIIDSTLYLYDRKDDISKALYKAASSKGGKTRCFVVFLKDENGNDTRKPLMMLEKDAPSIFIRHELYHIVERYMKLNIKDITKMFNFTLSYKEYNKRYNVLTGFEYTIKPLPKIYFDYMDASEIYSRLNNLKHFLHEYNYIKSPNDTIPKEVFIKLFTGKLYKELPSDNDREKFRQSDFMDVLLFMDLTKQRIMDEYVTAMSPKNDNKV